MIHTPLFICKFTSWHTVQVWPSGLHTSVFKYPFDLPLLPFIFLSVSLLRPNFWLWQSLSITIALSTKIHILILSCNKRTHQHPHISHPLNKVSSAKRTVVCKFSTTQKATYYFWAHMPTHHIGTPRTTRTRRRLFAFLDTQFVAINECSPIHQEGHSCNKLFNNTFHPTS